MAPIAMGLVDLRLTGLAPGTTLGEETTEVIVSIVVSIRMACFNTEGVNV